MTADRRVTLLGGTFDPVHNGHLALARMAADAAGAAESWLVPSGVPNLRERPEAPAADRLAMLEAAVAGDARLRVVDIEMRREGRSYTIDTLDDVARRWPEVEAWWVLGADAARQVRRWHRSDDLLRSARFVVVQRDGSDPLRHDDLAALGFDDSRTLLVDTAPPGVSASEVRAALARGDDIGDLVPPAVAAVIRERGLYNDRG